MTYIMMPKIDSDTFFWGVMLIGLVVPALIHSQWGLAGVGLVVWAVLRWGWPG